MNVLDVQQGIAATVERAVPGGFKLLEGLYAAAVLAVILGGVIAGQTTEFLVIKGGGGVPDAAILRTYGDDVIAAELTGAGEIQPRFFVLKRSDLGAKTVVREMVGVLNRPKVKERMKTVRPADAAVTD